MKMRNIELGDSVSETSDEDDPRSSSSIKQEEVTINSKTSIQQTITSNNNGEIHTVKKKYAVNEPVEDTFDIFNISDVFNRIKSSVQRNTQLIDKGNVTVGDNNKPLVPQFTFDNMLSKDGLRATKVDEIVNKDASVKANNFNQRVAKEDSSFWKEEVKVKDPLKNTFLNIFLPEVENLTGESSTTEYLNSVVHIMYCLEEVPMILEYVKNNRDTLKDFIFNEYNEVACTLFNKLLKNIEK